MGIEPYMAATAIAGTLAQRLVRKLCPHCKVQGEAGAAEAMAYETEMQEPAQQFFTGPGCSFCGFTGFIGRIGVFEVLSVTEGIRKLVASGASGQEIRAQALEDGMDPLRRAGMITAQQGVTTISEVMRKVFFID